MIKIVAVGKLKEKALQAPGFPRPAELLLFQIIFYSFEYPYGLISASSFFPSLHNGQFL